MSMMHIAYEIDRLAAQAKRGTEHEDHDGSTFPHDHFGLYCGCGAALVDASMLPSEEEDGESR
ncbi:hypothetical protein [Gordonia oryzae]|nr:hypothetical protein [Gordonia oryzae]